MKDLIKPLVWKEGGRVNEIAYVYDFSAMYMVYKTHSKEFAAALNIDENLVWQRTGFACIEEAKSACEQHYAESLWDNLSPRAKVALSIGMATLAQLGVTDEALAEIIEKQNP